MAALENTPMGGVEDTVASDTPPPKRRGGVTSLSMGAMPRTGTTPKSPAMLHDVATPRQGTRAPPGVDTMTGQSHPHGGRGRAASISGVNVP